MSAGFRSDSLRQVRKLAAAVLPLSEISECPAGSRRCRSHFPDSSLHPLQPDRNAAGTVPSFPPRFTIAPGAPILSGRKRARLALYLTQDGISAALYQLYKPGLALLLGLAAGNALQADEPKAISKQPPAPLVAPPKTTTTPAAPAVIIEDPEAAPDEEGGNPADGMMSGEGNPGGNPGAAKKPAEPKPFWAYTARREVPAAGLVPAAADRPRLLLAGRRLPRQWRKRRRSTPTRASASSRARSSTPTGATSTTRRTPSTTSSTASSASTWATTGCFTTGGELRAPLHERDQQPARPASDNTYDLYRTRVYGDLWYRTSSALFVEYIDAETPTRTAAAAHRPRPRRPAQPLHRRQGLLTCDDTRSTSASAGRSCSTARSG